MALAYSAGRLKLYYQFLLLKNTGDKRVAEYDSFLDFLVFGFGSRIQIELKFWFVLIKRKKYDDPYLEKLYIRVIVFSYASLFFSFLFLGLFYVFAGF